MKNLQLALSRYNNSVDKMGPSKSLGSDKESAKLQLTKELGEIRSKNSRVFWVLLIMTIIVFLLSCFFVYRFMDDPPKIKALFGATGITISGLLVFTYKLWKQKTALDMLLALIPNLDADTIKTISATLLKNYLGGN